MEERGHISPTSSTIGFSLAQTVSSWSQLLGVHECNSHVMPGSQASTLLHPSSGFLGSFWPFIYSDAQGWRDNLDIHSKGIYSQYWGRLCSWSYLWLDLMGIKWYHNFNRFFKKIPVPSTSGCDFYLKTGLFRCKLINLRWLGYSF